MFNKKKSGAPDLLSHEHFILDAELIKSLDFEKRASITAKLIKELMKTLGMEALGPLEVYDATDMTYPGWSFIQPITTSHISGHYFEESKKASHIRLDIYSCKTFNWEKVISILHKNLDLSKWSANYLYRNINLKERTMIQISGNGIKVN